MTKEKTVKTESLFGKACQAMFALVLPIALILLLASLFVLPASQIIAADGNQELSQAQAHEEESIHFEQDLTAPSEKDLIDAQTSRADAQRVTIPETTVPLTSFSSTVQLTSNQGGSYYNTLVAMLSIASMIAMLVLLSVRKTRSYRVIAVRTVAVAFGLVTIATWSLLDKLQVPAVVFNSSSLLITIIFGSYVVIAIASYVYEAQLNKAEKNL